MKIDWDSVRGFVDDMANVFSIYRVSIEEDSEGNMLVTVYVTDTSFSFVEDLEDILGGSDWGIELRGCVLGFWKRFGGEAEFDE